MASVAMAPGMFLAQSVVPSSGSTAMSTLGPAMVPTFSPMNSIGASSISPSPITTVPSIGSLPSSRRMASTAAWSDFFSAPRPRKRAAATAARSVTRAISIDSARSKTGFGKTVIDAILVPRLIFFDSNNLRPTGYYTVGAHGDEGFAPRILAGRVGDHDHRHRLAGTARPGRIARPGAVTLYNGLQRYALLRQPQRNGRGRGRPIARQQPDVIAAFVMLHRRLAYRRHARSRAAERRRTDPTGDIGEVGHHGGSRRHAAGAGTDQRDRRQALGIDRHRIGHAHDLRDGGILRHHGRVHALLDALPGLHRHAEELYAIAQLIGRIEIGQRDRRDALDIDRLGIEFGAEGQARQDRKLLRGVVAFDVEGRIGFRIAEPLCVAQAIVERKPILLHAGEDVIAGAVEDAVDAGEGIAAESLAQSLDDRNAGADRSLEIERDLTALGERRELLAVSRQQRLVGGHHRLAGSKRAFHRPLGGIARSTHQLDKHVDRGILRQRHGIGDPAEFLQVDSALLTARPGVDRNDLDRPAAARRELVAAMLQKLNDSGADGAQSGKTDFQRRGHGFLLQMRDWG